MKFWRPRFRLKESTSSVAYKLTPYGLDLEDTVVRLALWGTKSLGQPKEGDFFNLSSLAIALKAAFDPEQGQEQDLLFEIRLDGERVGAKNSIAASHAARS